jgi:rhamnose utilization protein RhaD (predicted bifunctional aldolase and dehydrogenase)/NAD(P)-dependent dehydrogenase (short-subunit alcohol dehydrogenase family)
LWVKGSGGDLGTLTAAGLAGAAAGPVALARRRLPGVEREDEMVAAFDHCLFGRGGAAPSIDTAMHGLVDVPHVDHLHPDSGIAIATAADGPALTKEIFGDRVLWVPWRRPGFQLGLDIAAVQRANPQAIGVILGGHGITAWGSHQRGVRGELLEIIQTAAAYLAEHGRSDPFGARVHETLPEDVRRERAAQLFPILRGLASTDRPQVGHYTDSDGVLDFVGRERMPALAALGTSCPDHFLRHEGQADGRRHRAGRLAGGGGASGCASCTPPTATTTAPTTSGTRTADSPPMRGADPAIVLGAGVGMFSFGATSRPPAVAGEFYVNAINVMRGAESVSTYEPIDEAEKFRIEYWALEEAKLRGCRSPAAAGDADRAGHRRRLGIGRAIAQRLAAEGACVVVADRDAESAAEVRRRDRRTGQGLLGRGRRTSPAADRGRDADAVLGVRRVDLVVNNAGTVHFEAAAGDTEADWTAARDVIGQGLVPVCPRGRPGDARPGHGRRHRLHLQQEIAVRRPEQRRGTAPRKADQAHQVRLLAAELGEQACAVERHQPRRRGRGSGIFSGGWGAQRAAVYGVPESNWAPSTPQRTLLKREVLPEHVANAVFALTAGDLSHTTGTHIPVDAGRRSRGMFLRCRALFAAVDLGASSGRVMVGSVAPAGSTSAR